MFKEKIYKYTILVLCISMILQCSLAAQVGFAADAAENPAATEAGEQINSDNEFKEEIDLLSALQVLKDGSVKMEEDITRAEFTSLIVRILGLGDFQTNKEIVFEDVPSDHWAVNDVKTAYDIGIISGNSEGGFIPDEKITYEQVVKMIVCALGYDFMALQKGGYPAGYWMIANDENILRGLKVSGTQFATRGNVLKMLYNSLEVPVASTTGYGESVNYEVSDDITLLSKLDIEKVEGRIVANGDTTLAGESTLKDNQVAIGSEFNYKTYSTGATNAGDYLGYPVIVYVKQDKKNDGDEEIVYVKPDIDEDSVVKVKADDIQSGTTRHKFIYLDGNDKDEEIKGLQIDSSAYFIYNGQAYVDIKDSDLKPQFGQVTLLDADGDGKYDTVFVDSYDNIVVDRVSTASNKIFDKYVKDPVTNDERVLELDPGDNSIKFELKKNDKSINLSDLKEWDVLSVKSSKNTTGKKLINVTVVGRSVNGTISELSDENTIINDKEYEIGNPKLMSDGINALKLNDTGTFYFDVDGKISAFKESTGKATKTYVFLQKVAKGSGISSKVEIRVFTVGGVWEIYELPEKIRFKEKTEKTEEIAGQLIQAENSVITVTFDSEKTVSAIETAEEVSKMSSSEVDRIIDSDTFRKRTVDAALKYRNANKSLGNDIFVSSRTVVFKVPAEKEKTEYYSVQTDGYSSLSEQDYYIKSIYDESKLKSPKIVVIESQTTAADRTQAFIKREMFMIGKITQTIVNGEKGTMLYGVYKRNSDVKYPLAENVTIYDTTTKGNSPTDIDMKDLIDKTDLKPGDLIQIEVNNKNEITLIDRVYAIEERDVKRSTSILVGDTRTIDTGYCTEIEVGEKLLKIEDRTFALHATYNTAYIFDEATKKVTLGTVEDIEKGDFIVNNSLSYYPVDIAVIRFAE